MSQGLTTIKLPTAGAVRPRTRRRSEIRDAALTLFSERGYHGTGMGDIAAAVGLRASSLYNHVTSKQLLLVDIMNTTMIDLITRFDGVVAATPDPTDALRAAMEAHVNYHGVHRREARVGNREIFSLEDSYQAEVRGLRRAYARRWQDLIDRGVAVGVFTTPSPQLSTYALIEMGIGVAQWFRESGPLGLDEVAAHYGAMAVRQLESAHLAASPKFLAP